jgi:hypothetical protein
MAADITQVRPIAKAIIAEGRIRPGGPAFWVTHPRARTLIDAGVVALVAPMAGPSEAKPAEPAEKKSSSTDPAIRSTDSQKSTELGTVRSSSVSPADRVSPARRSRKSGTRETDAQTQSGLLP